MENGKTSSPTKKNTSKELLRVTGDGSSKAVIESLFKPPPKKAGDGPRTFKIARSPLLDQLQTFLPQFQKANEHLLSQPQEQIDAMNIECTNDDSKVVEMNIMLGEMASECNSDSDENSEQRDPSENSDLRTTPQALGPVTSENIKMPSEAKSHSKREKNLIQVISDAECEIDSGI
ncbi:NOP protein chaperone 1-like [Penaeus japonicus]|uniref:NOP protein chaperone 1-like n=1 Tax=Penaeus japonicus TaxID=27405 RepID=UPI001C7128B0|nr:NOP protein chaperone 1-like [Penaeus japonicus]